MISSQNYYTRALFVPDILWSQSFPFLLPIFDELSTSDHPVYFRIYNESDDGANLEIYGEDEENVSYWEDIIKGIIISSMNTSNKLK